jgi:hypothetical protein
LLREQSGQHPLEMLGEDKSGRIWVVDRQHMGKFHAKKNDVVQQIQGPASGFWSSPAYWQQKIYYAGVKSHLSMYSITDGLLFAEADFEEFKNLLLSWLHSIRVF